jgi:hypothetical protein
MISAIHRRRKVAIRSGAIDESPEPLDVFVLMFLVGVTPRRAR